MDSKYYVSLEAARLLKEKGYNEDVTYLYNSKCELQTTLMAYGCDLMPNEEFDNNDYAAPTKAEAIDWLESKGIVVEAFYLRFEQEWFYDVFVLSTRESYTSDDFQTRLEAEDAAIIRASELL